MDYYNILEIQGINKNDIKKYYCLNENNQIILFVELFANQRTCPHCNNPYTQLKEYKHKTIKALPLANKETIIDFYLPRYKCKVCNLTYTHKLNTSPNNRILKPVIDQLIIDFQSLSTFTDLAKKYFLSTNTILNLFDQYCPNKRVKISDVLCIDEFSNVRKSDNKYACMLLDFSSHKIVDIIKNRTLPYLRQYFSKQPLSLRDKVKYIITDMYDGYITIANEFFHNAVIVIDAFHYMTYFTNAIQNIRRRIFDSHDVYLDDKSWMGKHWRLLSTNPQNYPSNNMTLPNGQVISYYDRIVRFVKQNKELEYAFWLLQEFFSVSYKLTHDRAISYIPFIIKNMVNSTIPELIECGNTWLHYQEYIINSFIKFNGVRLSNGPIEGVNSRVKALKKLYCGYRDEQRFYNRIILIINAKRE